MRYIIMAGGKYKMWEMPKQLTKINGETLIGRTIRLLRENGVTDISISSNSDAFNDMGVPVLRHRNDYYVRAYNDYDGYWCDCFYPTDMPTCYIFGDVYFSPEAIRKIVSTDTDDIMLFGSKAPFAKEYPKPYIEPFAFKVRDTVHLKEACRKVKELDRRGKFKRRPLAWETWNVICGSKPNHVNDSYVAVNDYTCDIDTPEEAEEMEKSLKL